MKKRLFSLIVVVFIMGSLAAQDYSTGIGVRGGLYNGVTIKHFLSRKSAAEGIVATRWGSLDLTALYEINKDNAFDIDRLNWYYGVGGHIGLWNGDVIPGSTTAGSYMAIGVDGILGIEYNFVDIPINVSLDWKPRFNIIGYSKFYGDAGALSLRYIF